VNYEEVRSYIPGNRRWVRWCNCCYLQRFRGTVRIRYGYRYRHSQVIAVWYRDGRFKFKDVQYYPSMRWRLNQFMPDGFEVFNHRYYNFLSKPKTDHDDSKAIHVHIPWDGTSAKVTPVRWVWIHKGKVKGELSPTFIEVRSKLRLADIQRDLPRRRGRYWLRKARGVYRRNICGRIYPHCAWKKMWPKPTTNWRGECGCEVYTKQARSRDTVSTIMEEQNATVRTAKIQIYGIERFFEEAGCRQIDKEAGYELITLDTGRAHVQEPRRWGGDNQQTANVVLTALRMTCSTTGKVYVNTVPPQMRTVSQALDWMYDIPKYLERVGTQT